MPRKALPRLSSKQAVGSVPVDWRYRICVLFGRHVRVRRGAAAYFLFLILARAAATATAFAQPVPNIAQPGREREQLLERRLVPRAQPGGPAISLPSTEAPAGAATTLLTVRRFQIVGATVYSEEQFAALYRDL